jgi:Trk K+ transport system NAD-binding subunit
LVFICGLASFLMGVDVSDRPGVPNAAFLTQAYYTVGLFVLGGLDLGVPLGGPTYARALLWFAYFAAPAITASAVIEGVLRAIRPRHWALRRMSGHIVIAGCGKVTMQYLARLRANHPTKPVVVVETQANRPNLDEVRDVYDAFIVTGDINSDLLLSSLRLDHADRVLLLTGDDFANLDSAARILQIAPNLGQRIVVHVADLHFMRLVHHTHVADEVTIFNTHQIAAQHLVTSQLVAHFHHTEPLDTIVIAGFGRFGQTVLDQLQRLADGKFDRVALIDIDCTKRSQIFEEQVGFSGDYEHDTIDGDLRDPELWRRLESTYRFSDSEPAFVIGSGEDGINLHTALWLKSKYPRAFVVARSFRTSPFALDVSRKGGFRMFSVADLVSQSIPDSWVA